MNKNKRNFSEYVDYLVFEKKIFNSKITPILLLGLFIICIFGVVISINKDKDNVEGIEYTSDEKISILEDYGYSKAEIEEMEEDTLNSLSNKLLINSRNQLVGDEWATELDAVNSSDLKIKYYQYASSNDYSSIVDDFNAQKQMYRFSESYNKKLIRIYNDAYVLKSTFSNSFNTLQQENTLNNLNDERMLLFGVLQSDVEVRNKVLVDRMSLSFSNYDHNIRVNSVTSASMGYMAKNNLHDSDPNLMRLFNHLNEGSYIIYKINFSINTDSFNAYLYKNCDTSKLNIFGIYAENKSQLSNNYKTVSEMDSILSTMNSYESEIKEDFITNESIATEDDINSKPENLDEGTSLEDSTDINGDQITDTAPTSGEDEIYENIEDIN